MHHEGLTGPNHACRAQRAVRHVFPSVLSPHKREEWGVIGLSPQGLVNVESTVYVWNCPSRGGRAVYRLLFLSCAAVFRESDPAGPWRSW